MSLKSKIVEVQGYGAVEIREPLFDDIEGMFFSAEGGAATKPTDLIRKCLFKPGTQERIFDGIVGAALGMQLMKLAPEVMEFVGLTAAQDEDGDSKKGSRQAK